MSGWLDPPATRPHAWSARFVAIRMLAGAVVISFTFAGVGTMSLLSMLQVRRRTVTPPPDAIEAQVNGRDGVTLDASWLLPDPAVEPAPPAPEAQPTGPGAPPSTQRCVLILHGLRDSRRAGLSFAPMFNAAGYAVLAPDSRGHGVSGGDTITYGLEEKYDVVAWTAWMRRQGCQRIYGFGQSLGASVLIEAAGLDARRTSRQPLFAAIVAEAPFADLLEIAEYRASMIVPLPGPLRAPIAKLALVGGELYTNLVLDLDFAEASPVRSITRTATPVLLIHGLEDNRTPPSHSEELAAARPESTELWLVPGTRHIRASRTEPEEFRRRVLGWFATH